MHVVEAWTSVCVGSQEVHLVLQEGNGHIQITIKGMSATQDSARKQLRHLPSLMASHHMTDVSKDEYGWLGEDAVSGCCCAAFLPFRADQC